MPRNSNACWWMYTSAGSGASQLGGQAFLNRTPLLGGGMRPSADCCMYAAAQEHTQDMVSVKSGNNTSTSELEPAIS